MTFKPPQKRTDNPCTCGQKHADPSHSCAPECLSLYPKQPAPGDVGRPAVSPEACLRADIEMVSSGSIAARMERSLDGVLEAKDATIKTLADALVEAFINFKPCGLTHTAVITNTQHRQFESALRLAGRLPKENT